MKTADLVARFTQRPRNFAWFLGAGASRAAGLPTASDLIWDLKLRQYCREENQDVARQDLQNAAVRERIQSYFDARGFPPRDHEDEYTAYFERIFGSDRERQRQYISASLADVRVSLAAGNRVFGALLAAGQTRIAFTTNFDTVVENAVAKVGGLTLAPYHLEGARAANTALNNEDYPLYCKLHGDFRYDSLKNLSQDLEQQNDDLSSCLVNAASRFGFVVVGYSGRDNSVMRLFQRALEAPNPFPHGLYWTVLRGAAVPPAVSRLIEQAASRGVDAAVVEIPTFDAFMLHLWRNLPERPADLDAKVRRSQLATVDIPLPAPGRGGPLVRLTGLPILSTPEHCHSLTFAVPKEWRDLRQAMVDSKNRLILTKGASVLAWGARRAIHEAFGADLESIAEASVPGNIDASGNYHVKGFFEHALALSLARERPVLTRTRGFAAYLIANPHSSSATDLSPLADIVGNISGTVPGLLTTPTPQNPDAEQIQWAEALRISIAQTDGRLWMLLHPDVWIWPPRARQDAGDFMRQRRRDRLNRKYNELLDAWLCVLLGRYQRGSQIDLTPFKGGDGPDNPHFVVSSRTAFARRVAA